MFLDEEHIVAVLIKPLAWIFVWIVQLYHTIIHQAYVWWNVWVNDKQVVPKPASDSIVLIPAVELAQKIRNRQLTALEVIEAYIKRIELVDPMIHAFVQRNYQNAVETAKAIDSVLDAIEQDSEELNNLAETKPLLGVPFTIKDQFLIKGLRTTVGMPCRKNAELATDDADIVKSLREAGAIPLGLSNVPEGIMWGEGTNTIYPRTLNPYDTRCAPGGSSSGEGALLGAAGSVIGVGSDIAGSIRVPALLNGIFGLKPSPHLSCTVGQIPPQFHKYQNEMYSIGPMCRYAVDLLPLFKILIGPDNSKKLRLDEPVDVQKLRFFSMERTGNKLNSPPMHSDTKGAFLKTIEHFKKVTKNNVPAVQFETAKYAANFWFTSTSEEGGLSVGQYFGCFGKYEVRFFHELPKWLRGKSEHTSAVMLALGIEEFSKHITSDRAAIEEMRDELRAEIIELLGDDGVLIWPSFPYASYFHSELLWNLLVGEYSALWNALALPVIACPVGLNDEGVPLGVQLISAPHNERLLIAAAIEIEKAFGGWQAPPGKPE
ncbi:hypothetical protein M3Y94_01187400 [Aphelenchoides besseyi]|nr:hypothetical protein M3Y94_01187400 [Aphelenchoides besseyi]KAI6228306.1 Amidase domain-containing protein [Aphelenchoides besseyi]